MKGALLDYITSLLDRIGVTTRLAYKTRYELADLQDDDLVTKYLLTNSVPPPKPDPTPITQFVTVTPLVIEYNVTTNPDYILVNLTALPANLIDKNTNVTYDGTNFTIMGADDGSGHFADSFTFQIRP